MRLSTQKLYILPKNNAKIFVVLHLKILNSESLGNQGYFTSHLGKRFHIFNTHFGLVISINLDKFLEGVNPSNIQFVLHKDLIITLRSTNL